MEKCENLLKHLPKANGSFFSVTRFCCKICFQVCFCFVI